MALLEAIEPVTLSIPPAIVVGPVYVLMPLRIVVPKPYFMIPPPVPPAIPPSEITPETVVSVLSDPNPSVLLPIGKSLPLRSSRS